jgi:hypothetical protein
MYSAIRIRALKTWAWTAWRNYFAFLSPPVPACFNLLKVSSPTSINLDPHQKTNHAGPTIRPLSTYSVHAAYDLSLLNTSHSCNAISNFIILFYMNRRRLSLATVSAQFTMGALGFFTQASCKVQSRKVLMGLYATARACHVNGLHGTWPVYSMVIV